MERRIVTFQSSGDGIHERGVVDVADDNSSDSSGSKFGDCGRMLIDVARVNIKQREEGFRLSKELSWHGFAICLGERGMSIP